MARDLRQDDYQLLMNCGCAGSDKAALLGSHELDLVHVWPNFWLDYDFDSLLRWLPSVKASSVIAQPVLSHIPLNSLSLMQRKAFDIVHAHTFGTSQQEQLLMIVVGTAGTGKSYLIDAIRQLFSNHSASSTLKVTAPSGIAAANIRGSTIYSVFSLLSNTLTGTSLMSFLVRHLPFQPLSSPHFVLPWAFFFMQIEQSLKRRSYSVDKHIKHTRLQ